MAQSRKGMPRLTRRQRVAAAVVAPLAMGTVVWLGAGAASSANGSTPPEMPPPPSPISEQDGQPAAAAGQASISSVQPTAEDVAKALGITQDEAKNLLELGQRYADGLTPIQAGPEEENDSKG